jgi:hypothetical protein
MNGRPPVTRGEVLAIAALLLAFFGETVAYFAFSRFYGQGITYLANFIEIGLRGYVRVYLLEFSYYPPFYYAILLLLWPLFHLAYAPYVLCASALFAAGGGLYAYVIVRRLAGTLPALLALAVFLLVPGTTLFAKSLQIEAPLLLFIPAAWYHLLASEGFAVRRHAVLLGVVTGLGLLTKWTFPVYAGPVYAVALGAALWNARGGKGIARAQWIGLAWWLGLTLAIAGPWYGLVFDYARFRASAANDPRFVEYDFVRQLGYSVGLLAINMGKLFGPGAAIITAALLAVTPWRGRLFAAVVFLLAVPFVLFAIPVHMEDRYLYPLVPAIALIAALAVGTAKGRALRAVAGGGLVLLLVYNHLLVYLPLEPDKFRDDDPVVHRWGALFWGEAQTPAILDVIDRAAPQVGPGRFFSIAPHPLWTSYHDNYVYLHYFLNRDPRLAARFHVELINKFQYADFSAGLGRYDFLVVDEGMKRRYMEQETETVREYLAALSKNEYIDQNYGMSFGKFDLSDVLRDVVRIGREYVPVRSFRFEDAYDVTVYMNRKLLPTGAPGAKEARP